MNRLFEKIRHSLTPYGKQALPYPADALVLSSQALTGRINDSISRTAAFMDNASLSAKFFPYEADAPSFIMRDRARDDDTATDNGLPVPPRELWEGYGDTVEEYLAGGREHFTKMSSILSGSGFELDATQRVLDFGCSAGRLIRYCDRIATSGEVRGIDISARHIAWCQTYLSPPFRFTTTTTYPHLPFEDNSFELIYSGSVFTHIADLGDAWLLELRRILQPRGRLYITVHDDHTVEILKSHYQDFFLTRLVLDYDQDAHFIGTRYRMFSVRRSPHDAMVFYHRAYLEEYWGREMTLLSITPEAYGYQSAVLLSK
jgi:SAM-dependent methyltransferase